MKKKLWIILALVAALCVGVFAFCSNSASEGPAVTPDNTEAQVNVDPADLQNAIEYLRAFYKGTPEKTTADYKRISTVRVGDQVYNIVWTVDVDEEHVKVIVNDDGTVTIDVNEESEEEIEYTLTATITDAAGNSLSTSWKHILPGVIDEEMLAIVDQAYALEEGQSLPEAVTLRGVITSIDTPYDSSYKNISVVIAVPGREDKPILCYRLKGAGAEDLAVGDTITVTGIIKNYKGTIEFDAGCTLDSVVKGENEAIKAPEDPAEIMKQAYALSNGMSLPYTATLTGTITSVDEAYSTQYNNITVTMLVENGGGYSIKCYRMKGTGVDTLNVNDIITVTGQIKNYNGTIEFNFPNLDSVIQKAPPTQPNDPTAVVDAAYKLEPYKSLPYTATLTGKVTDIKYRWSEQYPTVSLTMVVEGRENKPLYCYSMTGSLYDMQNVEIGDTVTVSGMIKNYYSTETGTSTIEYDHPTLVKLVKNTATAPSDPKQIVDEAFDLEPGEVLEYKATLTGKIVTINTPYDSGFKNITVTIAVEGSDGMKNLMCYRLAGNGAADLAVGDTITVTGNIKNYKGTVEFDQGCTLDKVVKGDDDTPKAPEDPKQIVDEAFELGPNESLPYEAQLTGTIVSVDTPYDSNYKNITVSMEVEGSDGMKVIKCYRLKGTGAENLAVGDEITVKGTITNYYNSEKDESVVEFTAGCQLVNGSGDGGEEKPEIPEAGVTNVAHGDLEEETAYKFYVEHGSLGKVLYFNGTANSGGYLATTEDPAEAADVYMEKAEDGVHFYFMDGETKTYIEIYLNADNKPRPKLSTEPTMSYIYDSETELYVAELGDNNYYYGTYGTYDTLSTSSTWYITGDNAANRGDSQFVALFGTYVPGEEPDVPVVPEEPTDPEGELTNVAHGDLEEETAYKFYLEQKTVDKVLFYNGEKSGNFLATTEDPAEAVDVFMEKVEDGARFYYMDGETKTYIEIEQYTNSSGNLRGRVLLSTEPTMAYTYDEETGLYIGVFGDEAYYYGTYSNYETFSTSSTYYITGDNAGNVGVSQYVAQFGIYTPGEEPEDPDVPVVPETPEIKPGPYLFYVEQANMQKTYYFNGQMENVYLATTEAEEEAVPVYMEEAEGGMRLYFLDGETKTYIEIYLNDAGKPRHQMVTEPTMVYTYDEETQLYVAELNGTKYYNGTYGTYTTISASSTYYITGDKAPNVGVSQFVANFKEIVTEDDSVLTIAEAIAMGGAMEHNTYTEEKYSVTGKITEVYNTMFGNMRITDEEGNILTIYGTFDADGTNRYDAMEVKPVAGDTVTIYGIVGQYNGTPQIKNGWITEHIPGEGEVEPDEPVVEPEADSVVSIADAIALGKSKDHNTYTAGKYYVTGVITEVYNTQYGNMYIADADGNKLTIYGSYSADGSVSYKDMEVQPVAGDTVTIYGPIGQYGGTPQIKNGWITEHIPAGEEGCAHENLVHMEAVEAGCHMNGNIEHWYCNDCETVWQDEALTQITNHLNVVIPATGEGNLVHMEAVEAGCHYEGNVEYWICYTCEQVWTDEALTQLSNVKNVVVPAVGGDVVHVEALEPTATENGNIEYWYCETCEQVWQDEALTQLTNRMNVILPATGQDGTAEYPFVIVDEDPSTKEFVEYTANVPAGALYFYSMENVHDSWLDSPPAEGVMMTFANGGEMWIKEATGNYSIYVEPDGNSEDIVGVRNTGTEDVSYQIVFSYQLGHINNPDTLNLGEKHIEMWNDNTGYYLHWTAPSDGEFTFAIQNEGWLYTITNCGPDYEDTSDDEVGEKHGYYDDPVVDSEVWEVKEGDLLEIFVITYHPQLGEGVPAGNFDITATFEEAAVESELTIEDAIALGESMEHNTYTEESYYVTGVIKKVYNTQFGNMYLVDEAGNQLTIYGTYDADGTNGYADMDVKPVAGDTVTIYGPVGQYNGTAQIKNGWIVDHIPGEGEEIEIPEDPEADTELTIEEALAVGEYKEHNTYTDGKYYVTGVIKKVYNTTYGNMYLIDENGNELTIYGTFDADGVNRYDAMDVQPVAGDTVTIYGPIGQYNGTVQIKNGWITDHVPAEAASVAEVEETTEE